MVRCGLAFLSLGLLGALSLWTALALEPAGGSGPRLRVLAYSSFVNSWGPGPEIARAFFARTGIEVEWLDGGDANLLALKAKGSDADAVVGFDQLTIPLALASARWRALAGEAVPGRPSQGAGRFDQGPFLAFDWSPIAFVYRAGEIDPPRSLAELADPRFARALAFPDPRTSSPGFQLVSWAVSAKGFEGAFAWFGALAPNVVAAPASWSAAYGLFQKRRARVALAYWTSPLYHRLEEGDASYVAARFDDGHPAQIEFVGVPESCAACSEAIAFARWLRDPLAQRSIMRRNFMLPVEDSAADGSPFAESLREARRLRFLDANAATALNRDDVFARWASTGI